MCISQVVFMVFQIRIIPILFGILMFVFFSAEVHAQRRVLSDQLPANRWSLDVKYGLGIPFAGGKINNGENTPEGENPNSSQKYHYYSTSSYSIGIRYMISRDIGLRT